MTKDKFERYRDIADALCQVFQGELANAQIDPLHEAIRLSHRVRTLANGMNNCSIKLECKAGCGWLMEYYDGDENTIDYLRDELILIKSMLENHERRQPPSASLAEIVSTMFSQHVRQ